MHTPASVIAKGLGMRILCVLQLRNTCINPEIPSNFIRRPAKSELIYDSNQPNIQ